MQDGEQGTVGREGIAISSLHSPIKDPKVKEWGDKVYEVDTHKYRHLVEWMVKAQNRYPAEVISRTLELFLPYAEAFSNNWWPYLDQIIDHVAAKASARGFEAEHEKFKADEHDWLFNLINVSAKVDAKR